MVGAMSLLILVIAVRSLDPDRLKHVRPLLTSLEVLKGDPRMVGTLLAVFLGAGAAGTLIAGPFGPHRPPRYMVGVSSSPHRSPWASCSPARVWSFILLGALGVVLVSTFTGRSCWARLTCAQRGNGLRGSSWVSPSGRAASAPPPSLDRRPLGTCHPPSGSPRSARARLSPRPTLPEAARALRRSHA